MRYKAEIFDRMQLLYDETGFNDHQVHCEMRFSSSLDEARLRKATMLSLASIPILATRYCDRSTGTVWESLVEAELGRAFAADEDQEAKDAVAVIGYGLWQQCFGGDPRVLGSTIRLNRAPVTVVGVAPPAFDYPERTAVWTPTIFHKKRLPKFIAFPGNVIGRVREELTLARAGRMYEAEMRRLHPESLKGPERHRAKLVPLRDSLAGPVRQASLVLLGAVALVLLIACANVAQLLLSRVAERRQELMVRAALGASRGSIAGLVLKRGLLMTLAGAVAGGLGFIAIGRAIESQLYEVAPSDPANAAAVVMVLFACAVCACLRPAWDALRQQPISVLREM